MGTLLIPSELAASLSRPTLMDALAEVHRAHASGAAVLPAPVDLHPGTMTATDPNVVAMTGLDAGRGLVAVKVLADRPADRPLGLPAQRSTIALFDSASGECVALVDGRELTRIRTAAVTAVATRALARPGSRTLGLVGAGALAVEHVHALAQVLALDDVLVWSRSAETAERLAEQVAGRVPVSVASTPRAVFEADVVCTLTPSTTPIVRADWLRPGQHVNAVGSPPRHQFVELHPDVWSRVDLAVVDDVDVATRDSGNITSALAAGTLTAGSLTTLGHELTDPTPRDDQAITVFNSIGIALQDLAAARLLMDEALTRQLGVTHDLRSGAPAGR